MHQVKTSPILNISNRLQHDVPKALLASNRSVVQRDYKF
jgi:hypothetical protein